MGCPSPLTSVDGWECLASHWATWQQHGAETWVVDVLQVGYLLPFEFPPPLSDCPFHLRTYIQGSPKDLAFQEVMVIMKKRAVEVVKGQSPGFLQPDLSSGKGIRDLETSHRPVFPELFH